MAVHDVPKYQVIYRDLRGRIASGDLAAGARLPNQAALAEEYGVTLMTVRQALSGLVEDGLIQAARGRGTFVSLRPFQYRLNHLSSFAQEMAQQGQALQTRVLAFGPLEVEDPEVRTRLALPQDEPVHLIERLRLVDGRPTLLQRSYVPSAVGARLKSRQLERESLYDLLADFDTPVTRAIETLRAVSLTRADAAALLRARGAPALLSIRLSLGRDDTPVVFDRALMPGDSTEVTAERRAERVQLSYRVV